MSAAMESSPPPAKVPSMPPEPVTARRARRETTKEKARRLLAGMFDLDAVLGMAITFERQQHFVRASRLLDAFKDEPERVTARRLAKAVFVVTKHREW